MNNKSKSPRLWRRRGARRPCSRRGASGCDVPPRGGSSRTARRPQRLRRHRHAAAVAVMRSSVGGGGRAAPIGRRGSPATTTGEKHKRVIIQFSTLCASQIANPAGSPIGRRGWSSALHCSRAGSRACSVQRIHGPVPCTTAQLCNLCWTLSLRFERSVFLFENVCACQ
jgi:hypothetical protein